MKAIQFLSTMLLTVLVSVPTTLKANGAAANNSNSTQLEFSDIDKNGNEDILFYNTTTGDVAAFMMNGSGSATGANFVAKHTIPTDYIPAGIVDINKDGNKDLLFMNVNTGDVLAFMMNNQKATGVLKVGQHSNPKQWKPIGTSDIDKNGNEDILFYNTTTGDVAAFMMNGSGSATGANFVAKHTIPTDYIPAGIVDINKDGNKDLLFMNVNTGDVLAFMMNNQKATGVLKVGQHSNPKQWKPIANSNLLSYQTTVSTSSNGKYSSQLNSFIANNIGKSVYNPRGGGEALRGQCVSLVTQWQNFIGKGPGYFEGDYPIPAFNSLVNGNYGSIVAGDRNIEIIRNVAEVQPGDILIINTFPGATNGFSHTAIATSTLINGKVEIFESNANNAAPNTTATMGSMNSSKFYGAVRYK
jgi:hypothetical protein